ncbi:MAG: hypothetical protein RL705_1762 [Bacteroidota bacterium]
MKLLYFAAMLASLLLMSCNSEPSLQKYYVNNAEKKDFVALDISPSIINVDKAKLTPEQKTALESFDRMNILAFKIDGKNQALYKEESQKLSKILKGQDYQQLMKIGEGKDAASISFVGDEDDIDEFILFAKREENGFAVVRILGDDMNPNNIMNMLSILKSANINMEQLKPLEGLIK